MLATNVTRSSLFCLCGKRRDDGSVSTTHLNTGEDMALCTPNNCDNCDCPTSNLNSSVQGTVHSDRRIDEQVDIRQLNQWLHEGHISCVVGAFEQSITETTLESEEDVLVGIRLTLHSTLHLHHLHPSSLSP
eukprot:Awhi_evm2s8331